MAEPLQDLSDMDIFPTLSHAHGSGLPAWRDTNDHSDRGYDEYSSSLGLDFELFQGKRILDIGSGRTARFAREAAEHDVDVISVNPQWSLPDHRADGVYSGSVAATAEALPFADDSFDFAVSFWGVPLYLPGTSKAYGDAFRSIQRVLKPDTWALLCPAPKSIPEFDEILDSVYTPGGHELVWSKAFPMAKLIVYNEATDDTRQQVARLIPSITAASFRIW